jgi:hypothetical protein
VMKVVGVLASLFLDRLPPIPAMNKWVASYPMLCWMVLGRLCHKIMVRCWREGVLSIPGLQEEGNGEGEAAVQAADAAEVGRQDNEEAFRRMRARRAKRVALWMTSETRQLWSVVCLWVTEPLACELGKYLADELMYSSAAQQQPGISGNAAPHPWVGHNGGETRPPPTLKNFMADGMAGLREVQCRIACLLNEDDDDETNDLAAFLRQAFPQSVDKSVFGALQQLCLETLSDLFLRFTCEYRAYPYKLLKLLDTGVAEVDRRAIASEFLALPRCCMVPSFEGLLKKLFPTVDAVLSAECMNLLDGWAENQVMITKQIEFGHRGVGSHARAKGPAKPSEFQHIADSYVVNRLAVLHNESVARPRKSRPKIKQHPQVQVVLTNLKVKGGGARAGIGGNPKYFWLNERRRDLKSENLSRDEFTCRVRAYTREYDQDIGIQQHARDLWRVARLAAMEAQVCQVGPVPRRLEDGAASLARGFGPWRLGDSFWPLSEVMLKEFVAENSARGGMWKIVKAHRKWQGQSLALTGSMATAAGPLPETKLQTSCACRHPGKCVEGNRALGQGDRNWGIAD